MQHTEFQLPIDLITSVIQISIHEYTFMENLSSNRQYLPYISRIIRGHEDLYAHKSCKISECVENKCKLIMECTLLNNRAFALRIFDILHDRETIFVGDESHKGNFRQGK